MATYRHDLYGPREAACPASLASSGLRADGGCEAASADWEGPTSSAFMAGSDADMMGTKRMATAREGDASSSFSGRVLKGCSICRVGMGPSALRHVIWRRPKAVGGFRSWTQEGRRKVPPANIGNCRSRDHQSFLLSLAPNSSPPSYIHFASSTSPSAIRYPPVFDTPRPTHHSTLILPRSLRRDTSASDPPLDASRSSFGPSGTLPSL
jgi:hypothetical protein